MEGLKNLMERDVRYSIIQEGKREEANKHNELVKLVVDTCWAVAEFYIIDAQESTLEGDYDE